MRGLFLYLYYTTNGRKKQDLDLPPPGGTMGSPEVMVLSELSSLAGMAVPMRRRQKTTSQLLASNGAAARFGLSLTEREAAALALRQQELLAETGRVEFGEGVMGRLAFTFCDSPYLPPGGWAGLLEELMACFYEAKSGTELPDDEVLAFMKDHFDGDCGGSVDALAGRLEAWAQDLRLGVKPEEPEEPGWEEEADEE